MLTPRSPNSLAVLTVLSGLCLSLAGCGDLAPAGGSGDSGGSSIPAEVEAAFVGSCAFSGCHDASTRSGGLSLAPADLDSLIGKPSGGSSLPLVEIGNVTGSYLAIKMLPDDVLAANGLERSGSRMPTTSDFTNPNNATILAWIAGAEFPGDGGTGSTGSTGSDSDSDSSTGDGVLDFDSDIWPIFQACSCHLGGAGGLTLTEADAYANIVGVPSAVVPGLNLIEPDEPENSYLLHKLLDTQGEVGGGGTLMPPGDPLSAAELDLIEEWILAGAPE